MVSSPTQAGPAAIVGAIDDADGETGSCPLCGGPAYGWLTLPDPHSRPTVGMPATVARVIDRCGECGAGIERAETPIDLEVEVGRIAERRGDGSLTVRAPNRASLQAAIGGEGWAALDGWPGRLLLTPRALGLLAERTGRRVRRASFTWAGRNQRWMWQTLLNGLTLHPNFAHQVRSGRLRPSTGRGRTAFIVDCIVTALAAPLVLLVSAPLELAAAALRRGGELTAELER